MKILHYTLGFPPARSGGLVGYAIDVMQEQVNQGHTVYALFPGRVNVFNKKMYIKEGSFTGISTYELINSLPLPIFGGVKSPQDFMKPVSEKEFDKLLKKINPDVIHVHTLMGIPKEFFEVAKKQQIKIVFTSHDYFGLAPEPNFFFDKISYDDNNSIDTWYAASRNAMSTMKLRVFQLRVYPVIRYLKNIVMRNRKKKKSNKSSSVDVGYSDKLKKEYGALKAYYVSIFNLIDKFHFNSSIAYEVYKNNLQDLNQYDILTITNASITKKDYLNNRIQKEMKTKIAIAYIGPDKYFKGFYEFLELKNRLDKNSKYEFHTYGYSEKKHIDGISQHGRYRSHQLTDIYNFIDILVVPSKWKETFGLIVLEAIAHNTKVYASANVGAKDILPKSNIYVDLDDLIKKITHDSGTFSNKIKNEKKHVEELVKFYQE